MSEEQGPIKETPIKIPAWSQAGEEAQITATKRCITTRLYRSEPVEPTSENHFQVSRQVLVKEYTTDNCPVYEIEKCLSPENDPGLQAAGVEVCAVVRVEEDILAMTRKPPENKPPTIHNSIVIRPAGCELEIGPSGARPIMRAKKGERLPEGIPYLAPAGKISCVHTAAYVGPLEGIAKVSDEQLAMKVGTEEALPKEIRYNPLTHFGALWSYVEGIVQEGIANIFQAAAGPGEAPVGFNTEMQKQMYQAILQVAPEWAENNLLPIILEVWRPHIPSLKVFPSYEKEKEVENKFEVLDDAFSLRVALRNPTLRPLITDIFDTIAIKSRPIKE